MAEQNGRLSGVPRRPFHKVRQVTVLLGRRGKAAVLLGSVAVGFAKWPNRMQGYEECSKSAATYATVTSVGRCSGAFELLQFFFLKAK